MPDDTDTALRAELVGVRRSLARLEQQAGLEPSPLAVPSQGYRLVNPGDVVQSDDHNMVMFQSVPRFASAAARSAAIPTPSAGQLSILTTAPGRIDYWSGSAWLGTATLATYAAKVSCPAPGAVPGASTLALTWPVGLFAAAPIITATIETPNSTKGYCLMGGSTTSGGTLYWQQEVGAAIARWANVVAVAAGSAPLKAARDVTEGFVPVTVTCPTPGCVNQDQAVTLHVPPDVDSVVCGPCGTDLTAQVVT